MSLSGERAERDCMINLSGERAERDCMINPNMILS